MLLVYIRFFGRLLKRTSLSMMDGAYIMPFKRWYSGRRKDIDLAMRSRDESEVGKAGEVWDWCEETVIPFLR